MDGHIAMRAAQKIKRKKVSEWIKKYYYPRIKTNWQNVKEHKRQPSQLYNLPSNRHGGHSHYRKP